MTVRNGKTSLLPYKFTLLSNYVVEGKENKIVLLPYKFTLLSNIPV